MLNEKNFTNVICMCIFGCFGVKEYKFVSLVFEKCLYKMKMGRMSSLYSGLQVELVGYLPNLFTV